MRTLLVFALLSIPLSGSTITFSVTATAGSGSGDFSFEVTSPGVVDFRAQGNIGDVACSPIDPGQFYYCSAVLSYQASSNAGFSAGQSYFYYAGQHGNFSAESWVRNCPLDYANPSGGAGSACTFEVEPGVYSVSLLALGEASGTVNATGFLTSPAITTLTITGDFVRELSATTGGGLAAVPDPVPEPAVSVLLVSGLLLMARRRAVVSR